jgi:predicted RNase H-like HicB family nuclease
MQTVNDHYHMNVFWSAEDDCWIADVPDLCGCSAHGDTPSEAAKEAEVAIKLWLEVARDNGFEIPEPRYRPAIYAFRAA